jgi:PRTRC genetic system protein A
MKLKLVEHMFMEQETLPPMPWPYGYLVAHNGVFVWARRDGLEALIPVVTCTIPGLYPVDPYVRLHYPPVDAALMREILHHATNARAVDDRLVEMLFFLKWEAERGWQLIVPVQEQEAMRVRPVVAALDSVSYANTLIEVHSHQRMAAFFSSTDSADEQGFRLYAVLGKLDPDGHEAEIRLRVGVYGHFHELPTAGILSLPEGMTDCVRREAESWQWKEAEPDEGA